ncbi:MAG TPA: ArsR family transcriptional regulator [Peptococcaceae bacterium]|nr:ArsR family transcriptional regulator [Peptococcaceae bacterium]
MRGCNDGTDSYVKGGVFKTLVHPTRLRIIELLRHGQRCVCELIEELELEQPNISQHLAVLRKQDIVEATKDGLRVIYRIKDPRPVDLLDLVGDIIAKEIAETLALMDVTQRRDTPP